MPNAALRLLVSAFVTILLFAPAATFAAVQRTFVASTGNDVNPCSIPAPCRSFSAAIAQTNGDGEVIVLDSAGYGPFSVTKAISVISPPGIYAGITASGQFGIDVVAGSFDTVVLRGLTINGQGGVDGIRIVSAKQVHIEDCVITNMQNQGVYIPGGNYVRIANTLLRSNGKSGVFVPTANTHDITLSIENTQAVHNGQAGYFLQGGSQVTLHNSSAIDNAGDGVLYSANASTPNVVVVGGEYSGNGGTGVALFGDNGAVGGLAIHRASVSRNASNGITTDSTAPVGAGITKVHTSISHSHVAWNGGSGLGTGSFGAYVNWVTIAHSVFSENGVYGIQSNGGPQSFVNISANSASRNADTDLAQTNAGTLNTFGNNALTGNAGSFDITGSLTSRSLR
jgi:hypothetical protein